MTNEELIGKAAGVVKARKTKNGLFADVGCALISGNGKVYLGVDADVGPNAICAERAAMGAMMTDGEYRIKKIVAVWKDEKGVVYVIAPCGNCRQYIRDADEGNLETEVVLDKTKAVKLKELLPYCDWWQRID